ncbi:MAG: polysaccharide pyruvyl transferase family protein [Bacteroidales bacterium]|nr:polysaccharide pyruvyl transferase family protein [Bacteroidales bacterium]MCF8390270.1 polysaccharide pyruvyl transferase family protein [Bacteroidales bacterium]
MRVGLLTFHSAHNYGAVLQTYATQQTIRGLGHNIDVIDYCPDYLIKQHVFLNLKHKPASLKFKLLIESLFCFFWRYKRRKGFDNFIQSKLNLSSEKYGNHPFSSNVNYDAYVMGSDQIWNIKLTKGFDDVYWGNFIARKSAIKISYAASMSNYRLEDNQKQKMLSFLKNFHSIGVREEELKHYLSSNFKIKATTVLDPTFLIEKSDWKKISKNPQIEKKYILVYSIQLNDDAMRIARSLAKSINAVVIELTASVDKKAIFNNHQTASPEEFLGLFENAEFIITSSFHGTAFAIIYNKPFFSIRQDSEKDYRQKTILEKLGLLERFISRDITPDFQIINYDETNKKLELLRNESKTFLKSNLLDKK